MLYHPLLLILLEVMTVSIHTWCQNNMANFQDLYINM